MSAPGVTDLAVSTTGIDGLLVIAPKSITDGRGTVREFFRISGFRAAGVPVPERWAQVNVTSTGRGAVRGLHGEDTAKLVGVVAGAAFGAYLDTRPSSPTYGATVTVELRLGVQVFVPAGVCNGFQATGTDGCEYLYCYEREWQPGMAGVAVTPLDPALGISWPVPIDAGDRAQISEKDALAPTFAQLNRQD